MTSQEVPIVSHEVYYAHKARLNVPFLSSKVSLCQLSPLMNYMYLRHSAKIDLAVLLFRPRLVYDAQNNSTLSSLLPTTRTIQVRPIC